MSQQTLGRTKDELRAIFANSMLYEILMTFGVPNYHPWDYFQWESINYCRLAHARLLFDFLEKSRNDARADDVVSEDFGYPAQPKLLTQMQRDRLNRDLLHFSYERLHRTPETKPWDSSILSNLLDPMLGFMRHVRDNRTDLFYLPGDVKTWNSLIAALESGRELNATAMIDSNRNVFWKFAVGMPLPDGKPTLTICLPLSE